MDLFSCKIIAWYLSNRPDGKLVITILKKAYTSRNAPYGLVFHSDLNSQYTCVTYEELLDDLNVVQSFLKKGYPFNNAVRKSLFRFWRKKKQTVKSRKDRTKTVVAFCWNFPPQFGKIPTTLVRLWISRFSRSIMLEEKILRAFSSGKGLNGDKIPAAISLYTAVCKYCHADKSADYTNFFIQCIHHGTG